MRSSAAARILRLVLPRSDRRHVLNELGELYECRVRSQGREAADRWYRRQVRTFVLRVLLPGGRWRRASKDPGENRERRKTGNRLDVLWQDIRLAIRSAGKQPVFSATVLLTIALGIGATTSVFSVVNGVMLQPLPYHDSGGLVTVGVDFRDRPGDILNDMSPPDVFDVEAGSPALESLVGYQTRSPTLTGFGEPTLVDVTLVSKGLFETFHLTPTLGRDLRAEEAVANAPRVAVISHGFWQDRFGESDDVLGRTIDLSGVPVEIVGVAPEAFEFPVRTRVWIPQRSARRLGRGSHTWQTIGRLAAGATVASAQAEADAIAARLSNTYPESNFEKEFLVVPLQDRILGDVRGALWILLGAVTAVLLIACANVANLLLIRASGRMEEVAVRAALGASRGRLATQMMVESGIFAVLGGVMGLLLAVGGVELLRHTSVGIIPRVGDVAVDGGVLLFAAGLVVAVTLLFGLSPAAFLARVPLSANLVHAGRRAGTESLGRRPRGVLLVLEVAMSVVLLVGAGLLIRSFGQLYAVDLGFETREMVRFTLSRGGQLDEVRRFYRTLEGRIATVPGVESVGSIYGAPLGLGHTTSVVLVAGRPEPEAGRETYSAIRAVSPNYLETARIPLIRGRTLEPSDDAGPVPVGVVNQAFVRENFPTEDPLGRRVRIRTDQGYGSPYWTIVGIVGDIRSESITQAPVPEIYVSHGHFGPGFMTVTVRGARGARRLLPAIRAEVRALDPNTALRSVETVAQAVSREVAPTGFYMLLVSVFAALALMLAAIGLYGVLEYLVSRRIREIGIRVALGARAQEIVRMVVSDGLRPVVLGLAAGLAVSLVVGRVLEALLFGITPRDPWTFAAVPVVLLLAALLAALVPARRATRVDPVEALRAE